VKYFYNLILFIVFVFNCKAVSEWKNSIDDVNRLNFAFTKNFQDSPSSALRSTDQVVLQKRNTHNVFKSLSPY